MLQWLQYRMLVREHPGEIYLALFAAAFLGLGVWIGARAFQRPARHGPFEPNTAARAALGISDREYEVLQLLAAGRSNKEIAAALTVSPNTIKTHVARLYEKLEAARRTEAIQKAREFGIIP
ncbi:MAG: response regulator transcription factor [Hyphomonadaceae bacterium]